VDRVEDALHSLTHAGPVHRTAGCAARGCSFGGVCGVGQYFTGKTVHPFVTYAVSGLGTTERDYTASCRGASLGQALAVRGEEVTDAGPTVEAWLRRNGLLAR